MNEASDKKAAESVRKPKVAFTIDLTTHISPAQAKKLLVEAIGRIPDSDLTNLRSGVVTVIA
jgi:hypothetical protein